MNKNVVINMFAGPGAGKSTSASGLFYLLKSQGVKCELVTEYAKQMVYSKREQEMGDQLYILAKQNKKMQDIHNYDSEIVIITDSPIILGKHYGKNSSYANELNALIDKINSEYNNYNIWVNRTKPYQASGRLQTESESREIDSLLKEMIKYFDLTINGNPQGVKELEKFVLESIIN